MFKQLSHSGSVGPGPHVPNDLLPLPTPLVTSPASLNILPCSLCPSYTGLLVAPQMHQTGFCLKIFATCRPRTLYPREVLAHSFSSWRSLLKCHLPRESLAALPAHPAALPAPASCFSMAITTHFSCTFFAPCLFR